MFSYERVKGVSNVKSNADCMDLDFNIDMPGNTSHSGEEEHWNILVDQVIKGNVIPVIGSELTSFEGCSISDILVRNISPLCNMRTAARSFSQLIPRFQVERKNDDIYRYVSAILNKDSNQKLTTPSDDLKRLLSVRYFPSVIYTSYDPTVEKAMRNIHGDRLRVYTFDNNADTNDDIPALDNLQTPTLYYMFGKANSEGRRFVLSDKDMLDFSRSWLAETDNTNRSKPANLSNALANKFLLVLGCDYTDWLFRFIWFAMKDTKIRKNNDEQKIGLFAVSNSADDEFIDFLTRSNTLTQTMPVHDFISELCRRIEEKNNLLADALKQVKFDTPQSNADVFISYSRADKDLVERLYVILTEMGLNVWFDRKELGVGVDFWKDIRYAIRTAKLFVPVLTNSIKEQYRDEHIYRDEWEEAIVRKRRLGNVTYICPLCAEDFDLEDRESGIPDALKAHNVRIISKENTDESLLNFANEIKLELIKLEAHAKC